MAITERGEALAENSPTESLPSLRSSATECQRNLIRAGLLAEARVTDVVRPYGLSGPTFRVLTVLQRAGEPLSPCNISDRMVVPRNTLTHILDVLEQQELVRRGRHPRHRGMVLVELTEKGLGVVDEILPNLHAQDDEWWASFSEDERRTLLALLRRAQEALAEPTEHAEHHHRHRHGHRDGAGVDDPSDRRPHRSHHSSDVPELASPSRKELDGIDS